MRRKKWAVMMGIVMVMVSLIGGNSRETMIYGKKQSQKQGVTSKSLTYEDMSDVVFWFGSGVGGWCTELRVYPDGTSVGQYHDIDMGDTGKGYPDGTVYICNFTGNFWNLEKINDYTYKTKIEHISWFKKVGTKDIEDNMRIIYSEPYGLEESNNIFFYKKGSPMKQLPKEYKDWIISAVDGPIEGKSKLPFYGLYNEKMAYGFSSYEVGKTSIDVELARVRAKAKQAVRGIEEMAQLKMNQASYREFKIWDDELNKEYRLSWQHI